jgi:hypothetical protein
MKTPVQLSIFAAAFAAACGIGPVHGQVPGGEPDVPEKAGKELRAFRLTGRPPTIDGQIDDEAWKLADFIDDMVQNEPDSMAPPTERTIVQVAFDDRYLYLAVQSLMRDPGQITAGLGRRDNLPPSDVIRLSFDPRHDHRTAFVFHVNPSGVQADDTWFDDTRQSQDYDAVWDVQTAISAQGWNAEFRIPFSQMRFEVTTGRPAVWGFNVRRDIHGRGEFDRWVPTPRGVNGFVSRFGHLTFPEPPAPPRRLELIPYSSVRREDAADAIATGGFDAGVDARVGLGTSATLAGTINPDFGQVEQDPAVLNLTVFETFYPEKRPFFIEDSRLFVPPFNQFQLFHSRRIGQRPGYIELDDHEEIESQPEQTTIYGAGKVTGKVSRWTYGGITAVTGREFATVELPAPPEGQTVTVQRLIEPTTLYGVGRLQRDVRDGSSSVGALATAVVREDHQDAFTGGIDYSFRWQNNRYQWDGHWAGTNAPVDGRQTTGFGGITRFTYTRKHFNINGHFDHFSGGFRVSDIGFLASRANKTRIESFSGYGQPDPWRAFRSLWGFTGVWQETNGDGVMLDRRAITGMDIQFRNFWFLGWNVGGAAQALDDLDTRGGPLIVKPAESWFNLFVSSDSRKTWRANLALNTERDEAGGWNVRIGPRVEVQPFARLQASISTSFTRGLTDAQWIKSEDVTGDGATDYVYGTLDRHVVDVTARATYAFHRDLTLQVYLQPFVAVGDYTNIRRLAKPASYEFEPVTLETNPDFNDKSFRANTVLRWEYRRGSTLFVVWNQTATDDARPGVFGGLRDLRGAFSGEGSDVFMVKMTYWLGL